AHGPRGARESGDLVRSRRAQRRARSIAARAHLPRRRRPPRPRRPPCAPRGRAARPLEIAAQLSTAMSLPHHFPFLAGHDPLRMGVAAIEAPDWFELDEDYAAQLAEKERLLAARRDEVLQMRPQAEAPARELLAAVSGWALATHSGGFARASNAVRC